jgi:outer membrane protein assembly factor BamA
MQMKEGQQFFINRITFVGNTTTHDNVIRREIRLLENGVFNTEALKFSVKRLNQLGYFKALEGKPGEVDVQKTAPDSNKVDVKLKLEEQNRNQLTFGAGVSEFEGVFGQLSFQTANFMGRGESLTVSMQTGSRAQNYSLAFTEPFLFDRNITGGVNIFKQDIRYIGQFTQKTAGAVLTLGLPMSGFSRLFMNYSYQKGPGDRDQRAVPAGRRAAAQPVPGGLAAHRRERRTHHQQGRAVVRLQHGRSADLPDDRQAVLGVGRSRRYRRQHELLQADGRRRDVSAPRQPADARHARAG